MSGAYGHIEHPYEDLNLTIKDIFNIIDLDFNTGIKEKTDGINLFITYRNNKLYTARNKSQLLTGGIQLPELEKRFEKNFIVRNTMIRVYNFINTVFQNNNINNFEKNEWLDIEIIDRNSINVINYSMDYVVFHDMRINNNIIPNKHIELVKKINTNQNNEYNIVYVDNKIKLNGITSLFRQVIKTYLKYSISNYIKDNYNITLRDFYKKAFNVDTDKKITFSKIENNPIEYTILRLGVELNSTPVNILCKNPDNNINQIRKRISDKNNEIINSKDLYLINKSIKLNTKINLLGGLNRISPIEGIIFTYKGKQYKLTGMFSPINQLLGILRYTR